MASISATATRPSCPTLMTSLFPTATGVYYFTNQLSERYLTLAEVLRNQGFRTAAFIQNNQAGRIAGLHQGYSHFFERYELTEGPQVVYSDRLESWLDEYSDENFFLYLHILDPHDPYEPEPPFDAWSKEPSKETPGQPQEGFELDRSNYDGEILGNDAGLSAWLNERGYTGATLQYARQFLTVSPTLFRMRVEIVEDGRVVRAFSGLFDTAQRGGESVSSRSEFLTWNEIDPGAESER